MENVDAFAGLGEDEDGRRRGFIVDHVDAGIARVSWVVVNLRSVLEALEKRQRVAKPFVPACIHGNGQGVVRHMHNLGRFLKIPDAVNIRQKR